MGDGVVVMPRGGLVGGREAWADARGETLISWEECQLEGKMRVCKTRSRQGEVLPPA